jgi:hypothetical protein
MFERSSIFWGTPPSDLGMQFCLISC